MEDVRPNIIFITCDHLRADFMGCAGHEVIQTPHLDELAQRGVRFSQAYSPTPICIPARASIMTGLTGNSLGITENIFGFEIPVEETLPAQLSEAGYQTSVVGKMHTFPERKHNGFHSMLLCEEGRTFGEGSDKDRGYDDYELWLAEQGYKGQAWSHGMGNNDYAVTPWYLDDYLHPTEWIGSEACKQIKRRDWTRPLFMWASFTAPHPPLTPPLKDLYMYDRLEMPKPKIGEWAKDHSIFHGGNLYRYHELMTEYQMDAAYRAYFALVTQVDRQINRITGTLFEEGLIENTWIIFTSDHGDSMGDHQLWQKGNFFKGGSNIPLLIVPPLGTENTSTLGEQWIPGQENHTPVGLQDIMPSILDIGNAKTPKVDGESLIPLVKEPDTSVREVILGEFGKVGERSFMVTDGKWKYIWYEEDDKELLFHIEEDPDEMKNLSQLDDAKRNEWRQKLHDCLSERKDDPAVQNGVLQSSGTDKPLSEVEKKRRFGQYTKLKTPIGLH